MDEALAAALAQQKARKVTESILPEMVARELPKAVLEHLPYAVKADLPAALAKIYVAPKDGSDGKAGTDGIAGPPGPQGPPGPAGFDRSATEELMAAWEELKDAILRPRKRKVLRDNMGRITGLTEG